MPAPAVEVCAQCGGTLDRAQVRVLVWDRLWIERVAAVVCRSCVAVALTDAGEAKVARLTRAGVEVLGIPGEDPAPKVEVVRVHTDFGRPAGDAEHSGRGAEPRSRPRSGRSPTRPKARRATPRSKGPGYHRRRRAGP